MTTVPTAATAATHPTIPPGPPVPRRAGAPAAATGARIVATDLTSVHRDGRHALHRVSLVVDPGELVAVIGPSGAGKSTLLDALGGVRPAGAGTVSVEAPDGTPVAPGVVPQEDVVHLDLPLGRMLLHAARLRLPTGADASAAVRRVLHALGLEAHAGTSVGALSGGQRTRASIAVELLAEPRACLLDEPTSGLDPASAQSLLVTLRQLCRAGSTIVFTTHSVADVAHVDRLVVLAPGGRLVWSGPPDGAAAHVGATDLPELYRHLEQQPLPPRRTAREARPARPGRRPARRPSGARSPFPRRPSAARQWWVLTHRSAETLVRNRLTLAILLGSPALVIAMFAVLFRPDALDPGASDPTAAVMVAFWLAFAAFFFGLTYGLLQVCVELPVVRRDHHAGVRTGPYLLSKVTLLVPFLVVVDAAMVAVLVALGRLPDRPLGDHVGLWATMTLCAAAALCLGLVASAAVDTAAQAALALPMLCFPAVLFAGAMVPVPVMTGVGRALAAVVPDRWAFEALARQLDVAAAAPPGTETPFAGLGASTTATYWALLAATTAVLLATGRVVVGVRARHPHRRGR